MKYTILSISFKGEANQVEEWCGTIYLVDPISESTILKWKNPRQPSEAGIMYPKTEYIHFE
jgi:hypothetical protein